MPSNTFIRYRLLPIMCAALPCSKSQRKEKKKSPLRRITHVPPPCCKIISAYKACPTEINDAYSSFVSIVPFSSTKIYFLFSPLLSFVSFTPSSISTLRNLCCLVCHLSIKIRRRTSIQISHYLSHSFIHSYIQTFIPSYIYTFLHHVQIQPCLCFTLLCLCDTLTLFPRSFQPQSLCPTKAHLDPGQHLRWY